MRAFLILLLLSSAAVAAPTLNVPALPPWSGPFHLPGLGQRKPRDFVTVVPKGAPEGYTRVLLHHSRQRNLTVPDEPGDYEVRLCRRQSLQDAASQALKVRRRATVKRTCDGKRGRRNSVTWTGPNNERDYIAIGDPARPYLDYKYTRDGSPMKLSAPEKPGAYEVRYILGAGDTVIAPQTVTVGAVTASLTAPAQVAAGAKFQVKWTGPDNPRDFVTLVKAGAAEKTYERYEYTSKGPAHADRARRAR